MSKVWISLHDNRLAKMCHATSDLSSGWFRLISTILSLLAKANHRVKAKAKSLLIEELFEYDCFPQLHEYELNWSLVGDTVVGGGGNFRKLGLVRGSG